MPFVLSIDFEDWHQLVHRRIGRPDWFDGGPNFARHVDNVLALLDDARLRATFFVAGIAAERHPAELREVVARGHDVACHGYEHRRVYRQTRTEFRRDVERCRGLIEDICGVRAAGYRAPWFSINRDARWGHDVLAELGFRFSSSLFDSPRLPRRPRPVPRRPFLVRDGLWEFPIASWHVGRAVLPLGGGAYWRALPAPLLRRGLARIERTSEYPVLYFHPYEFAVEQLFVSLPPSASARERARETARRRYKNARRDLIAVRLREAAARHRFVAFDDVLGSLDTTVLPAARALV